MTKALLYRHLVITSKRGLCDKEDEMAVEIRVCDVGRHVTGEDEGAENMFCIGLFSEDDDGESRIGCST